MNKMNFFFNQTTRLCTTLIISSLTLCLHAQDPNLHLEGNVTMTTVLDDGFEDGSLAPFTTSGDANWSVQDTIVHTGSEAAQSGAITHNEYTSIHYAATSTGPATVSFFAKVSSEANYDILEFYIDAVPQITLSGEIGWKQYTYHLTSGAHILTWKYQKDGSISSDSDAAWLDSVLITSTSGQVIRIEDGTEGLGKILVSDAFGHGRWSTISDAIQYGSSVPIIAENSPDYGFIGRNNGSGGFYATNNSSEGYYASYNGADGYEANFNADDGFEARYSGDDGFYAHNNYNDGFYAFSNDDNGFEANDNDDDGFYAVDNGEDGFYAYSNGEDGFFAFDNDSFGFNASSNGLHGFSSSSNSKDGFYAFSNDDNGFEAFSNGLDGFAATSNERFGFYAKDNLAGFVATENSDDGFYAYSNSDDGFYAYSNDSFGFNASSNGLHGFSSFSNSKDGFYATDNGLDGFAATSNEGNGFNATDNGLDGFSATGNANNGFNAKSNSYYGFYSESNSLGGFAATSNPGSGFEATSNFGDGFLSQSNADDGFFAQSNDDDGFYAFSNDDDGFEAFDNADDGFEANGNGGYGIYSINNGGYDGYFGGDIRVVGEVNKGSSTFMIDHPLDPENKYLYHSMVESPDMMNVYNGNVTTDNAGLATVTMPEWFDVLNRDFRYQLTVIGTFAQAIIKEELTDNHFVIQSDQPGIKVSWQITGIRQDRYAEQNRIEVEVEKEEKYKGRYLHYEAYDKPFEQGHEYVNLDYKTLDEVKAKNQEQ